MQGCCECPHDMFPLDGCGCACHQQAAREYQNQEFLAGLKREKAIELAKSLLAYGDPDGSVFAGLVNWTDDALFHWAEQCGYTWTDSEWASRFAILPTERSVYYSSRLTVVSPNALL